MFLHHAMEVGRRRRAGAAGGGHVDEHGEHPGPPR
ncbi:MAG: hypothetical protein QOG03_949, partial [Actinomycetota bacterium]|nr:hypothetical protein [Actinomycetota bacterium]